MVWDALICHISRLIALLALRSRFLAATVAALHIGRVRYLRFQRDFLVLGLGIVCLFQLSCHDNLTPKSHLLSITRIISGVAQSLSCRMCRAMRERRE